MNKKKVPTFYAGRTFDTNESESIEEFKRLSDTKKWEMGYWIEQQSLKIGAWVGLVIGTVIGVVITLFVTSLF